MNEKMLDLSIVAKRLDISLASAYRLINSNKLKFIKCGPKKGYKVREADLAEYLFKRDNDLF